MTGENLERHFSPCECGEVFSGVVGKDVEHRSISDEQDFRLLNSAHIL